ncbi:MAG TPA: hypothetical protein VJC03_05135, partial [bacterium]|nr:hypothetical protein [bacterium]
MDNEFPLSLDPMFPSNLDENLVEAILQICHGQASHTACKPIDPIAQIPDDLQSDIGMLQNQFLETLLSKAAKQSLFHTPRRKGVMDFFAEHILAEKVTG